MKTMKLQKLFGIFLAIAMCVSLLPSTVFAAQIETPAASDNAVRLYADYGDGFELLTSLYFKKSVTEQTLMIEKNITGLRVVKGECYTLHLDSLTLGGVCPAEYEKKLAFTDNDLLEITDSADFALSGSGELVIAARAPVELAGEQYSLKFPKRNRLGVHPKSEFYQYTLGSHSGIIADDTLIVPSNENLFVSEMCYPDSGHPAAPIDFYVTDDGETLYVFFEAFVDNTCDNGKDFAGVHVKCGNSLKTYKVYTTEENEYGTWWFDYTDSSDIYTWEHMNYLVKIPINDICAEGGIINLAFEYYGTVSLSDKLTRLNICDWNFVDADSYNSPWADKTVLELLPEPGKTKNSSGGTDESGEWWLTNIGTEDDPEYTLTLNGANITQVASYYASYYDGNYCYMDIDGSLRVILAEGTVNTIGTKGTNVRKGLDASSSNNFIIEGAGTLITYGMENPFLCEGQLIVRDGANVCFETYNPPYSRAVESFNLGAGITVDNASLKIGCYGLPESGDEWKIALACYGDKIELKNDAILEVYATGAEKNVAINGDFKFVTDPTAISLTIEEGNSPDTSVEVTSPTNLNPQIGYGYDEFYSKPYIKLTQTVAKPDPVAFTVSNIPKGGENTAVIGNGIDISFDSDKYTVLPDKYALSVTDSESLNWFDGIFQKGTDYCGSALVTLLDDSIKEHLNFDITGGTFIKYEPVLSADEEPTGEYKVYFSVPVTEDADSIDTVSFKNITLPKGGDKYYDISIPNGEHYTVNKVHWEDENKDIPEVFEEDKCYYLVVTLTPKRGYVFADNIRATVNSNTFRPVTTAKILGKTEIRIKLSNTITFNANGGTVNTKTALTDTNGILAKLPTPTYSGYTFNGWYTSKNGGTKVTTNTVFSADTEIYAKWAKETSKRSGGGGSVRRPTPVIIAPPVTPDVIENPFTDVNEGDYFYDAVIWAIKENIASGITFTTFCPTDICTRAQAVTFLWRAAGSPEPTSYVNPFTDVNEDDYFYKAVLWACENGIAFGTSNDKFSPNDAVTRGQMVTFLYRLVGDKTDCENPFADVSSNDYYYDSVLWAYQNDITNGTSDTTFGSLDNCLRGQIVTFLYRYYK